MDTIAEQLGRRIGWSQCFIFIAHYTFDGNQIIVLQRINRRFYKSFLPQWVRTVTTVKRKIWNTGSVCKRTDAVMPWINVPNEHGLIQYELRLLDFSLESIKVAGNNFDFVLRTGQKAPQRSDKQHPFTEHKIPQVIDKIEIYSYGGLHVTGFKFYAQSELVLDLNKKNTHYE